MTKLLDTISLPEGLRKLSISELEQITLELRDELITTVSECGGHFASSLGAAEISVALHHVFDTPNDRIVWDVGHQGYIHKMLTGRREQLKSIRQKNGLSGFLRREESVYDCFGAGHAGTSISAALGMAAAQARSNPNNKSIAVIGDGSISAGMALEALNHAGHLGHNLIVLLNDNEMSISPNVGAMSWLFSKAITSKTSTIARSGFKELHKKGYVPEFVYQIIDRAEEATQNFFATPATLFSAFGFRYIGPIDGHNIGELVSALNRAREQDVPVLIHAHTVKGKGYQPAEADPLKWHGVVPFDPSAAKFKVSSKPANEAPSYTNIFADTLIKIRQQDPKIIAITAAMPTGTGLDRFEKVFPESFYDVAICEQHAVTFAAGLACEGYKPVCAIYSTFLQRAYDQVVHDVCLQNLPVVFATDRAGLVGNDGHTHQGVFDISYLRCLPNIVIMSPKDEDELQHMLYTATLHNGPISLRYPRGNGQGVELKQELTALKIGKGELLHEGKDALLIAFGPIINEAIKARELLLKHGISLAIINARFAKPLDQELLTEQLPKYELLMTLEDQALLGGFGSAVLEFVNEQELPIKSSIKRFGVADEFVSHASQQEQYEYYGYDAKSIYSFVLERLRPAVQSVVNA